MEEVLTIWLETSIETHDFIERNFWESKVADMRNVYLPAAETYVYDGEGTLRGFVSLCGDTIAALFVRPSVHGKGIGTQLMNKAKERRQNLNLTVYKENHRGIGFYEKCGFRVETEQIDRHTGHPELLMVFNS